MVTVGLERAGGGDCVDSFGLGGRIGCDGETAVGDDSMIDVGLGREGGGGC